MPEFKINKAIDYNVEMFSLLSILLVLISITQNVKKIYLQIQIVSVLKHSKKQKYIY